MVYIVVNALLLYFSTSKSNPSLEVLLGPFPLSPPPISLLNFLTERAPFLPRLRLPIVGLITALGFVPLFRAGGKRFVAMLFVGLLL